MTPRVTRKRTVRKSLRPLGAATFATALLAVAPAATQATFPGSNGLIAYVSDGRPGLANDDIYVTDQQDRQPAVWPNGKEIAFYSTRDTPEFPNPGRDSELYVMDAMDDDGDRSGDNLRRLTDNAEIWARGGATLEFTRREPWHEDGLR